MQQLPNCIPIATPAGIRSYVAGLLLFLYFIAPSTLFAQWEVAAGGGFALPIKGYGEVMMPGLLLQAKGKYRLGKGNLALGMETQFTRLVRDKNGADEFDDARLVVAPLLFFAEQEFNRYGKFRLYVVAGLGISIFDFHYEITPFEGKTYTNVSFTMSPQLGFRYAVIDNIIPFAEASLILLADGPPMGVPQSGKITGYGGLTLGLLYRFSR